LALVKLCLAEFETLFKKKKKQESYKGIIIIISETLSENNFTLKSDVVTEFDLWRKVRNNIIHSVGICKNNDEAMEFSDNLELDIEKTQLRIMAQKHNCIQMLNKCDELLFNVFRENIFKGIEW